MKKLLFLAVLIFTHPIFPEFEDDTEEQGMVDEEALEDFEDEEEAEEELESEENDN